jgi:hypothetical protein
MAYEIDLKTVKIPTKTPTSVQNGAVTKYAYVYSVSYINSKTGQRLATDAARVELGVQLHLFDTGGGTYGGRLAASYTWGFYCDSCERFFDLISDGSVEAIGNGYVIRRHSCGAEARYITFPPKEY